MLASLIFIFYCCFQQEGLKRYNIQLKTSPSLLLKEYETRAETERALCNGTHPGLDFKTQITQ